MAFPTIPTTGAGRVVTGVQANTTATRTFPNLSTLTKNSGDLLIAIVVGYQSSATAGAVWSGWTAGWTEFMDVGGASNTAIGAAYKWSDGTETGTISATQAATVTGHASFILLSIPGAHATTPPTAGAIANGTAAAANPAALNPADWDVEDTLWIAVGMGGETSLTGSFTGVSTTPPTNYTDAAVTAISSDVVGGVNAGVAFRQLAAASEDVGTWTVDLSNARNSAVVIAVRPAAANDHTGSATSTGTGTITASGTVSTGWTVTARHSVNSGQTGVQTATTNSVTPTANSMLLAFYGIENNGSSTAATLGAPSGGGLSFTLVDKIGDAATFGWGIGSSDFRLASACYSADVGASPTAHTVDVDAYSGAATGFYAVGTIDIVADAGAVDIVQSAATGAGILQTDNASGTITLGTSPTAGNLIVLAYTAGADAGGGFATPTGFTALFNQNASYCQLAVFYKVSNGTEGVNFTCSDLGDSVGNWTGHAIEVAAATGAVTGNATVAGTGAITTTGVVARAAAAALAAVGTVTAAGVVGLSSSATQSGTGAITATGSVGTSTSATVAGTGTITASGTVTDPGAFGTASLSGTGTITANGTVARSSGAAVAGAGTIGSSGSVGVSTGSTVAGTGTVTTTGVVARSTTAAVAGTGTITASGTVTSSGNSAILTGTGTLTAAGVVARTSTASIAGTGTVTAAGTTTHASGAAVAGTGTITAAGTVTATGAGNATLTGTGTIAATGVVARATGATLAGTSTVTTTGTVGRITGAARTGTGTITTTGSVAGSKSASIAGTGTLTAAGFVARATGAALSGTAAITASGTVTATGAGDATLAGTGTVTATGTVARFAAATRTGTGTLTTTGVVGRSSDSGAISGTGSLSATGSMAAVRSVTVVGVGAITASGYLGTVGEPASNPSVNVGARPGRVSTSPYAGTVRVARGRGTVTVEDA